MSAATPRGVAGGGSTLTPKQARFVDEYLVDLNGKQAAIRAGYSPRSAEFQASKLLANGKVQQAVKEGRQKTASKLEVTREKVIAELARIGFSDLRKAFTEHGSLINPAEMPDDVAAAVASIEVSSYTKPGDDAETEYVKKVRFWDKGQALQQLVRHLGLDAEQPLPEQSVRIVEMPRAALREKLAKLTGKA